MKTHLIAPTIFLSAPASFLASCIAFNCGARGGVALLFGFGLCTSVGWILMNRSNLR